MERDSIEKIINFVGNDLEKNFGSKNPNEAKNMKYDLDTLNSIIKYPITSKIILKNSNLSNKLFKLYEAENKDQETTLVISNIVKKLTENSSNNDAIIISNPEMITSLLTNLQGNVKQDTEIEKQILLNDLATFTNLVCENYKDLIDKNILTENDLKFICQLHSENPEFGGKLKSFIETLNSINQGQASVIKLNKDKEFVSTLVDSVCKLHERHLKEIDYLNKGEDVKSMVRLSTVKIIKQSTRAGTEDLPKLKSPLSVRDNPEALIKIDQILAMILKLNNELQNEKDQKILTEKGLMIMGLLNALKMLSIVPDNHHTILEMVNFLF